jgi:hypothetical protein
MVGKIFLPGFATPFKLLVCFCSATQFHVSEVSLGFPAGDTSSLLRQGQHHRCREKFVIEKVHADYFLINVEKTLHQISLFL